MKSAWYCLSLLRTRLLRGVRPVLSSLSRHRAAGSTHAPVWVACVESHICRVELGREVSTVRPLRSGAHYMPCLGRSPPLRNRKKGLTSLFKYAIIRLAHEFGISPGGCVREKYTHLTSQITNETEQNREYFEKKHLCF